jgi:serine/threonine protein kinase
VRLLQVLGRGSYGVVYAGRWVDSTGASCSSQAGAAGGAFVYDVVVKLGEFDAAFEQEWMALEDYMGNERFVQLLGMGHLHLQESAGATCPVGCVACAGTPAVAAAAAGDPATSSRSVPAAESAGASPGGEQKSVPLPCLVMKRYKRTLESDEKLPEGEASKLVGQLLEGVRMMHQGECTSGHGRVNRCVRSIHRGVESACLLACMVMCCSCKGVPFQGLCAACSTEGCLVCTGARQ